jgi:hypothetical protein
MVGSHCSMLKTELKIIKMKENSNNDNRKSKKKDSAQITIKK